MKTFENLMDDFRYGCDWLVRDYCLENALNTTDFYDEKIFKDHVAGLRFFLYAHSWEPEEGITNDEKKLVEKKINSLLEAII